MKKIIALMAGGYSGEYEISILSGREIEKHLDKDRYEVYFIFIDKNSWNYVDNAGNKHEIDKNDFSLKIDDKTIHFDAAYIIIHGLPGEDGKIQGYLDMMNIPYTGCNMYASAATFNKYYCKTIVSTLGIPTSISYFLNRKEYNIDDIVETVGLPCFVKPNKNGSSVGITKVYEKDKIEEAIEIAFKADNEVLIENFIKGREFSCGIFRNRNVNVVLPITEIIPKNDFFDYDAKYTKGKSLEVTPANLDEENAITIASYTNMIYEKLHCTGVVRIDYIVDDDSVYFLEVNAIPGMSEKSIVPQQLKLYGMEMKELINLLIDEAFNKK